METRRRRMAVATVLALALGAAVALLGPRCVPPRAGHRGVAESAEVAQRTLREALRPLRPGGSGPAGPATARPVGQRAEPTITAEVASADAGPGGAPPLPGGLCVLEGAVLESETELPVAGATVRLGIANAATVTALSGPDGEFRFAAVPTGTCTVIASAPGYSEDDERVELAPGRPGRVVVSIYPTATAIVRVVGPRGEPLPEAGVFVAGDRGRQGEHTVRAGPPRHFWASPGGLWGETVRAFAPGECAEVEIRLLPRTPARVLVRVADPAGMPLLGAGLSCSGVGEAKTGPDGSALLVVPPGKRRIQARVYGYQPAEADVEAGEGEQVEVALRLDPAPTALGGRVVDRAGKPVPGAVVDAYRAVPRVNARAEADRAGRFRFEGLRDASGWAVALRVVGPTGDEGPLVLYQPWRLPQRDEVVLLAGPGPRLALRLRAPEGMAFPREHATLWFQDEDLSQNCTYGEIAADGTVTFELPLPARYAWPLLQVDGFAPTVLPPIDFSSGEPDPPEREVALARPALVRGRALDREGAPLASVRVRAAAPGHKDPPGHLIFAEAWTRPDGRFALGGLPAEVDLLADVPAGEGLAGGGPRGRAEVRGLAPGEPREVDLRLE